MELYVLCKKPGRPLWRQMLTEFFWLVVLLALITAGVWAYVYEAAKWQEDHGFQTPNFIEEQENVNII